MDDKTEVNQPRPFMVSSTSRQWTTDVCDCFQDLPTCCFGFWCFPCFACKTAHDAGQCACLPLLDSFGFIPPMLISIRGSVRHRYGIQGSICNDCLYSFFCGPCTWCQISREIKVRGPIADT